MARRPARRAEAAAKRSAPARPPEAPRPSFPRAAAAALAATVALLVFVPADSNLAWAVNGLRHAGAGALPALLVAAALAGAWGAGARVPGAFAALAAALALAGPLREAGHLLGDTYVRWREFDRVAAGGAMPPFAAIGAQMHAQPLDHLLGVWWPLTLARAGVRPEGALAAAGFALALAWFATAAALARRLAPPGAPPALAAALAVAGSLQVFAAYAESGGLVLACAGLWWLALLRPLARPRDAAIATLAWLAFALSHRVALVALVPQFARALAIRLDGDAPGPRRALALGTAAAAALAAVLGAASAGGALARDARELLGTLSRPTPPSDLVNLLLVVAPLALLAPWAAGAKHLAAVARSPLGALHAAAFVPLLPLLLVFPMAAHGLGPHRDWELALVPGLVATTFAGAALARLEPARLRGALALLLPALVLLAGAWLAPNANEAATLRRAETLVSKPFGAAGEARGHALAYLGYRASDRGDDAGSARWFDASFASLGNRRTALLAAESWLRAGDWRAARVSLERARAGGALPPGLERGAAMLEAIAARAAAADSAQGVR